MQFENNQVSLLVCKCTAMLQVTRATQATQATQAMVASGDFMPAIGG